MGNIDQSGFRIETIVSPPFEENTFIVHLAARRDAIVVDPGFQPERIIAYLEANDLEPAALLNTHGHSDHIAGNGALKQRWPEVPLIIGAGDEAMLSDPDRNLSGMAGVRLISPPADRTVEEGDVVTAAGFRLEVLEVPGHSPGHVVFVWSEPTPTVVFGGDVLFAGSIGRFDFPGGNERQLLDGIRTKLFRLPDDTLIYPGHGEPTTIGQEKRWNPFVGEGGSL